MDEEKNRRGIDAVEKLQKELYSRNSPSVINEERHSFRKQTPSVREKWSEDKNENPASLREDFHVPLKKKMPFLKKSLIISIIFFVVASLSAFFIAFGGFNFISTQKVEIKVLAPSSIDGGEELNLEVSVLNQNKTDIKDLVLTIEYPEGARDPKNTLNVLTRDSQTIDFIASGGKDSRTFDSVLYGERQSVKSVTVLLEYKTEGSAATFRKEITHEIGIKSAPILITAQFSKELSDGEEAEFRIEIVSNSETSLSDLILIADYPFGFAPTDFSEKPLFENNVWAIGTLRPQGKKGFTIKGTISGQENEEKVFKFSAGSASPNDERLIGIEFVSNLETIFIKKAIMDLELDINETLTGDYIAQMGSDFKVQFNWRNNLPVDLNDAEFEINLAGKPLDKLAISASDGGFYKSQENKIIWNKNTTTELARIRPGQSGTFDFTLGTIKPKIESVPEFKNSEIQIEASVKGVRFYESQPPEQVKTTAERNVKIVTNLNLSSRTVYSVGPFGNLGPVPPEAEKTTTYTIIWSVNSNWNDAENVQVTASLPVYVEWLGKLSPSNSELIFNQDTRIISWNVGHVLAGTGYNLPPREVAFQLSITPSFGQVGEVPILVGEPSIIGTDTFTLTNVSDKKTVLTTRISTDPIYEFGSERVIE